MRSLKQRLADLSNLKKAAAKQRAKWKNPTKRCTRCGQEKPQTAEFFGERTERNGVGWLASWCRECVRGHARVKQAERRADKEKRIVLLEEKERHRQSEKGRAWRRKRYASDNAIRRARVKSRPARWSQQDWINCLSAWRNRCVYCGAEGRLTQDHFVPLSSSESPGTVASNIVPACPPCNTSKGTRLPEEWHHNKELIESIRCRLLGVS